MSWSKDRAGQQLVVAGGMALIAMCGLSLCIGAVRLAPMELWNALLHRGDPFAQQILFDVRLPRIVAAILAGSALAVCGAVLQVMYSNRLVDVGIAAVGPVAAIGAAVSAAVAPGLGHAAAATATTLAAVSTQMMGRSRLRGVPFALLGVAAGAGALAALGILVAIPKFSAGRAISSWLFGSLALADWQSLIPVSVGCALGWMLLVRQIPRLDVLSLGVVEAELLGVDLRLIRSRLSVAVAFMVGPVIAAFGVISFLGLAVPGILRSLGLRVHSRLIPSCAVFGACLLVAADTIARSAFGPVEVPVGFIVTLLGAVVLIRALPRKLGRD